MKYALPILALLCTLQLRAFENNRLLDYTGIDPAEVLLALYLNARPGPTTHDIITALETDMDVMTLDDLRLALISPEKRVHISTLWGNWLDATFNLSEQTLFLEKTSPLSPSAIKKTLQVLKEKTHVSACTYAEVATYIYTTWLAPFAYTQQRLAHWLDGEPLPEYSILERKYALLKQLSGTYSEQDLQHDTFSIILSTLSDEQIVLLMNDFQARALYKKGHMYSETASHATTTALRTSANQASKLSQAATIELFFNKKLSQVLKRELAQAEAAVRADRNKELRLYAHYLNQNKTRNSVYGTTAFY